jgi:DNA helicase-2/ATP-dependent DNA helicase PcrA
LALLDLASLNPEQRDAVTHGDGPLMILAGAGTGKTRVISFRVAYLLGRGVAPASIVALSFTNKAAREMVERTRALAGERTKDVRMGTFHSFCLALLRRFAAQAGLAPGFGLADVGDQQELVRKALEEKGWAGLYHSGQLHAQISAAKNALLNADEIRRGDPLPRALGAADRGVLAEVYALYERQLALHRVIDFDDCIEKTVRLLRANPDVQAKLKDEIRYILVDEFQDTNVAQLTVLELIANASHNVTVVGDDDQSIYSWRGAMYEILERFEAAFPGTRLVKLEQNYRCSNVILKAANTVIRNNPRRKDKTLWSESQETAPITLTVLGDEPSEARYVGDKILALLGAGMKPKDVGVLYRANAQARALEFALREARVPYKTFGGQSFFERKEVKDLVSYVRLVIDPDDRLAFWRVVNTPNRGIGLKTLEKLEAAARAQKQSPFAVAKAGALAGQGRAESAVAAFLAQIDKWRAMPLETPAHVEALATTLLKESGLEAEVRTKTENVNARDAKLANMRTLPGWLGTLAGDLAEERERFSPNDLLDALTLDNDRRETEKTGGNHVSLMTVHAAKGLEFPAVFVVGLEEELLPHKNSLNDPQGIAEERRLFYVALTRAKAKLFLSYCLERGTGYQGAGAYGQGQGSGQARVVSRFLAEVPADCVNRPNAAEAMKSAADVLQERRQKTAGKLGALRQSLTGKT